MTEPLKSNWLVVSDISKSLNFAIYIGNALRLLPETDSNRSEYVWPTELNLDFLPDEKMELKNAWHRWWSRLLTHRDVGNPQTELHEKCIDFIDHPPLRMTCLKLWPSFYTWWMMPAGGQTAMLFYQNKLSIRNILHEIQKEKNAVFSRFVLHTDYIYGGFVEVQEVTEQYIIIPVSFENKNWWKQKLEKILEQQRKNF